MKAHKFPYEWTLKDAVFSKDKGKVFSCFACGGGSTMGYKLAGFDVIGCNEIDPKMMAAYRANHNPRFSYLEPIQTFKNREDLPPELYDLDILDGSPPCSSFSMAGNRGDDWGKEKKFREGQAEQVLDTLFFDFIELAEKLKPKVVIAENVKGLLLGDAQKYVNNILTAFDRAGYYVSYKLLDASRMGVPQKRERVFFYAIRKDLYYGEFADLFRTEPELDLDFNEKKITFSEVMTNLDQSKLLTKLDLQLWNQKQYGDIDLCDVSIRTRGIISRFNAKFIYPDDVANTICAGEQCVLFDEPRNRNDIELCKCGTYPLDYDFQGNQPCYLIGMSVPPVMTAQVASRVQSQWLQNMTKKNLDVTPDIHNSPSV
jgi:DNA (cytosine-5)-methyltransferase 1